MEQTNLIKIRPYYLGKQDLDQYVFEFFDCESSTRLILFPDNGHDKTKETLEKFESHFSLVQVLLI